MLATLLISMLLTTATLWLAIKVVDPKNTSNTLGAAALIGGVFGAATAFGGLGLMALPAVALVLVLDRVYELTLVQSIIVVVIIGALNTAATAAIGAVAGL